MASYYPILALILVAIMLLLLETGRRLGRAHAQHRGGAANEGTGAVETAVFALFGLLLALTFSGAAARFEHRRTLVVQEANAIGTAYLRLDLLDAAAQSQLRPLFRDYVTARLNAYQALALGPEAFQAGLDAAAALQTSIWQAARAGAERARSPAVMSLVLPPINDMIDITATRVAALRTHPPGIIFALLLAFSGASALIAGYGMAGHRAPHWLHRALFVLSIAGTLYVILDLEYPRQGLIRVDSIDVHLHEVLQTMQP